MIKGVTKSVLILIFTISTLQSYVDDALPNLTLVSSFSIYKAEAVTINGDYAYVADGNLDTFLQKPMQNRI